MTWAPTIVCAAVCAHVWVSLTVEDLMRLVQASASAPELQARLRDTLNMARDTDKWRKLTRMLAERVSAAAAGCTARHSTAQHATVHLCSCMMLVI